MQNNTVNSRYCGNPQKGVGGGGRFSVRNSGGTREKLIDSLNIWNNCNCKKDEVSKVASWTIKRSDRSLFKNGFFTFLYRNVDLYYVSQDRGRSIWVSTIARKKQIKCRTGVGVRNCPYKKSNKTQWNQCISHLRDKQSNRTHTKQCARH